MKKFIDKIPKTYIKILIAICITLILISGLGAYVDIINEYNRVSEDNATLFDNFKSSYNYSIQYIISSMESAYKSEDAAKITSPYVEQIAQNEIDKSILNLTIKLEIIPYIHSAYIYNGYNNSITRIFNYSEYESDTNLTSYLREEVNSILLQKPVIRKIQEEGSDKYVVSVFEFSRSQGGQFNSALILNFEFSWLSGIGDLMLQTGNTDLEKFFIFSRDYGLIWSHENSEIFSNEVKRNYYEKLNEDGKNNNQSYSIIVNKSKYRSTHMYIKDLNTDLLLIQDYKLLGLEGKIYIYSLLIGAITILGVGIYLYIYKNKKPKIIYENILKNEKGADTYKDVSIYKLNEKEGNISEILQFVEYINTGNIKMSKIPGFIADEYFQKYFIMLSISKNSTPNLEYDERTLQIIKGNIGNSIREIFGSDYKYITIDLDKTEMVVLIATTEKNTVEDIAEFLKIAKQNLFSRYKISFAGYISSGFTKYTSAPKIFSDAKMKLSYKYIIGDKEIILPDDSVFKNTVKDFKYPKDLENEFVDAIKMSNFELAEEKITSIINLVSKAEPSQANLATIRMLTAFCNAIENNHSTVVTELLSESRSMFKEFLSLESLKDLHYSMRKVLLKLNLEKSKYEENKSSRMAANIEKYITDNFRSYDLNVSAISYHFSLSPEHIGKIFKAYKGITISQYIIDLRVNHAISLLKTKKYTVSEVSEKVGIANSNYFYKIFKKSTGKTPRQYIDEL